jgi:predicted ATP-binding protein involved in virulence
MEGDEYLFEHRNVPVLLGALSAGYRTYIGCVSDLLYHLSHEAPTGISLREVRGVVLVDEIDLHLHPVWQREVVPSVARTLPNLQFVFTTHSPIVAGTLNAKNIFVLEMDGQGARRSASSKSRFMGSTPTRSSSAPTSTSKAPGLPKPSMSCGTSRGKP